MIEYSGIFSLLFCLLLLTGINCYEEKFVTRELRIISSLILHDTKDCRLVVTEKQVGDNDVIAESLFV